MNSTCRPAGEMQGEKVKVKVKVNAKWDQDRAKNSPEVFLPLPQTCFSLASIGAASSVLWSDLMLPLLATWPLQYSFQKVKSRLCLWSQNNIKTPIPDKSRKKM